jgi:hypothetical protein
MGSKNGRLLLASEYNGSIIKKYKPSNGIWVKGKVNRNAILFFIQLA